MSYINDALRKAQRERDGLYGRFGGIIASGAERTGKPRKRPLAVGVAVALLVLVPAGIVLSVYVLQQPSPVRQDAVRTVASGNATASQPPVQKAEGTGTTFSKEEKPVPGGAEAFYQEALIAQRKGDLGAAEELYQRALRVDSGHVKALNNLGVIYMGQRMRGKAMAAFSRALVLKKDYVDPYYNLACLYAQTNEIDEGLWYLKVAMTINGDVKKWAEKDADLKNIAASPVFKRMMEGREN